MIQGQHDVYNPPIFIKRDTYVNHPLETSQGADHDNSHRQTVPQTSEANILVDTSHGGAETLTGLADRVKLADHDICGVRDDSTKNTGQVTSSEGDTGLRSLAVVILLSRQTSIDHLNDSFKRGKLHHGIRDLTAPEGIKTFVETSIAFLCSDFAESIKSSGVGVRRASLHSNLDSFHGAEGNVGEEFS